MDSKPVCLKSINKSIFIVFFYICIRMDKRYFLYFIFVPLVVLTLFSHRQPEQTERAIIGTTVQAELETLAEYHWQDDDDYIYAPSFRNRKANIPVLSAGLYTSANLPFGLDAPKSIATSYKNKQLSLSVLCVYRI